MACTWMGSGEIKIMDNETRFFFSKDNDGHLYAIPLSKRAEWFAWLDLDQDDEASWVCPRYAKMLGTHISGWSFTSLEKIYE